MKNAATSVSSKKVEVAETKFLKVKFQCPTAKCRTSNEKDIFIHCKDEPLKTRCRFCHTSLTRTDPGRWTTEDGTVVMAHETERVEKYQWGCSCGAQNEVVALDAGMVYDPYHTHSARRGKRTGHIEVGRFMQCHSCHLWLKQDEAGTWAVLQERE